MALQSSGQIKLSEIATEFGGSAPHSLSEYHNKGNAPASGEIQLAADFYGTSDFTAYAIAYLAIAGGGGASGACSTRRGGGGGAPYAFGQEGSGGSGIVIISVPDANYSGNVTGSPTVATGVSGKTVMQFTGSGSYIA